VPVDLHEAGDDVARMARAVFSDRVRLLWSSSPATVHRGAATSGGGGGRWSATGRWPSPGPARRPLYIPWRMRHFLAFARRPVLPTSEHDVTLDSVLVHFKEVGCHVHHKEYYIRVVFTKSVAK